MFVKYKIPYSGSVWPRVLVFRRGYAEVEIRERRAIRNHLQSVHAVALMNVAEFTSGIAMVGGLPPSMRAIVTRFTVDFIKKARGRLKAVCEAPLLEEGFSGEVPVEAKVFDSSGDVVCIGRATWLVGPKQKKEKA